MMTVAVNDLYGVHSMSCLAEVGGAMGDIEFLNLM